MSVGRLLPVGHGAEGSGRASAGSAIMAAPTAGEDSGHRIGIPIDKGLITCRVDIPRYLLHDVAVVDGDLVEGLRHMGERVDANSIFSVPISEVWDVFKIPCALDRLEKPHQRLLGRVSPEDKIDERVLTEDFLVIIGGRKPAEDDRDAGVMPFDHLGQG